jgi:E3 ubiquitin-protein ligase RFWD2
MADPSAAEEAAPRAGLTLAEQDLECPICMSLLTDPFVTACGHTFCYGCIATHLQTGTTCPSCSAFLTKELAYPNFVLSKLARRAAGGALRGKASAYQALRRALDDSKAELAGEEVDSLVEALQEHKRQCQQRQREGNMQLLLHFLESSREDKARKLDALRRELSCLESDIGRVEATCAGEAPPPEAPGGEPPDAPGGAPPPAPTAAMQQAERAEAREQQAGPSRASPPPGGAGPAAAAAVAAAVQQQLGAPCSAATRDALAAHPDMATYLATQRPAAGQQQQQPSAPADVAPPARSDTPATSDGPSAAATALGPLPRTKRRRIASQLEDLQGAYLRLRADRLRGDAAAGDAAAAAAACGAPGAAPANTGAVDGGLQEFSRLLSVLTRCSRLRVLAEVPRPSLRQSSSIISCVEYDRDGALFATAGVSKRISIFEHAAVVGTPGLAVHCPVVELVTRSKLSCLSWNPYLAAHLASSDYEGVVTLWDAHTASMVSEWEAHGKRVWSVDFCGGDPTLLASGSDDCAVKVWSTRAAASVAHLDLKANVCAVKWRPGSTHELAVGSADHSVYLYDLRSPAHPVSVFAGHRKAVSYVRWLGPHELASASTDSTLRLWAAGAPAGAPAARVFEGHANEKNFVGLAAEGGFLACGSESNEAVVYYKELCKPVARQGFPGGEDERGGLGGGPAGGGDGGKTFVSALCWRPGGRELLVANSQGTVRVMELTGGE